MKTIGLFESRSGDSISALRLNLLIAITLSTVQLDPSSSAKYRKLTSNFYSYSKYKDSTYELSKFGNLSSSGLRSGSILSKVLIEGIFELVIM